MLSRVLSLVFLFLAFGSAGYADASTTATAPTQSPDKSQYNLFHPTSDEFLRSYSADRPSQSTGPYTVDTGHFFRDQRRQLPLR